MNVSDSQEPAKKTNKRSVLHWYSTHYVRYVTKPLYDAGLRLQRNWELMSKSEIGSINYLNVPTQCKNQHSNHLTEITAIACEEFQKSMRYVGGPGLNTMLKEVICKNMSVSEYEQMQKWRRGCGSIVLHIALYRLALFYKKISEEQDLSPSVK